MVPEFRGSPGCVCVRTCVCLPVCTCVCSRTSPCTHVCARGSVRVCSVPVFLCARAPVDEFWVWVALLCLPLSCCCGRNTPLPTLWNKRPRLGPGEGLVFVSEIEGFFCLFFFSFLFQIPHKERGTQKHNTDTAYSMPSGGEHTRELSCDAAVKNPVSRGPEA